MSLVYLCDMAYVLLQVLDMLPGAANTNRENAMQDWDSLRKALRRQLAKRGIDRSEIEDRLQDASALLFVRMGRKPDEPIALAIWCCAGDAARGRTVHRTTAHGYVDALNPLDSRERAKIAAAQAESFNRRAALAQADLDDAPVRFADPAYALRTIDVDTCVKHRMTVHANRE